MNIYISLLLTTIRSALRAREDVALENLALRHQLAVMTRSARRPRLGPADRLLWCWLSRRWSRWRSAVGRQNSIRVRLGGISGGQEVSR